MCVIAAFVYISRNSHVFRFSLLPFFIVLKIEFVSIFVVSTRYIDSIYYIAYLFRTDSLIMCQYQTVIRYSYSFISFHFISFFHFSLYAVLLFIRSPFVICHPKRAGIIIKISRSKDKNHKHSVQFKTLCISKFEVR